MAKESFYGIDQLVKDYGLQVKTVWYEAFDEAGQTEVDYLRKTNLTENTMRSYERNPDDENRLFYVGATRTKENLHIIEPKKYEKGYLL
jgi:superfamily I DNA/RNA helicase